MAKKEPVVIVGPGVRVIVRNDCPPGTAYLVDAATVMQTDPETGEPVFPFSVARLEGL